MPTNIYLRSNSLGVERALHRCRAIGVGPQALRDAALHLLRSGAVKASDALRIYRGRAFSGIMTAAAAAQMVAG